MENLNARNPLSIIALFISLIYGISALLLGASVDKLSPENQVRLVWFIIGFPVAILFAFLYLVTWHHRKLYSPSDFRTDESFLTSGDPQAIGKKYITEGEPRAENVPQSATSEDAYTEEEAAPRATPVNIGASKTDYAAYAYMIEGLVMQELQNEYQSPIRRDAAFPLANGRLARVDGIIETPSGPLIVEIKLIRPTGEYMKRLRDSIYRLNAHTEAARELLNPKSSGILILVLDGSFAPDDIQRITAGARRIEADHIAIRVVNANDVMIKYGLPPISS